MDYFKKIAGHRVYLSPMNKGDCKLYTKWLNDPEVCKNVGHYSRMISLQNEEKALETLSTEGHNYAIVLQDGDTLIGNISLMNINHIGRTATLGVFIGEAEHRGKGLGSEAIGLLLEYGFQTLNLRNIMLEVLADNIPAISCYQKLGFCEIGRRRGAKFIDGQYIDFVFMDILDHEFREKRGL